MNLRFLFWTLSSCARSERLKVLVSMAYMEKYTTPEANLQSPMIQSLFSILSRYNPLIFEFTIINIFKVSSDITSYEEYA